MCVEKLYLHKSLLCGTDRHYIYLPVLRKKYRDRAAEVIPISTSLTVYMYTWRDTEYIIYERLAFDNIIHCKKI